jgi:hypothetical protein
MACLKLRVKNECREADAARRLPRPYEFFLDYDK